MSNSIPRDLIGKIFKTAFFDEFEMIINGPFSFHRYQIKQIVAIIEIKKDGTIHFEEVGWADPPTAKELGSVGCSKGIAELNNEGKIVPKERTGAGRLFNSKGRFDEFKRSIEDIPDLPREYRV